MTARMLAFFETYDLLLTPATIVPPSRSSIAMSPNAPARSSTIMSNGSAIVYAITLACCPALSLPCGFTRDGPAGRPADRRRRRAREAPRARRRQGAGGHSGPARHDADRSAREELGLRKAQRTRYTPSPRFCGERAARGCFAKTVAVQLAAIPPHPIALRSTSPRKRGEVKKHHLSLAASRLRL